MYCKICGSFVYETNNFCQKCGAKIEKEDILYRPDVEIKPSKRQGRLFRKLVYLYWTKRRTLYSVFFASILIVMVSILFITLSRRYDSKGIYHLAQPATVEITSYSKTGYQIGVGSGFIVKSDGEIITNYHVISGAYRIMVQLYDNSTYFATQVIAYSETVDVAIIKIDANNLKTLKLSNRTVKTGETVYAVGSPQGLTQSFTNGIVSQAERSVDNINCIQTTAPLSSGNSGGPLINVYGEVIGINSMTLEKGQNINFAINISNLKHVTRIPTSMAEYYSKVYYTIAVMEKPLNETEDNNNSPQNIEKNGTTVKGSFYNYTDSDNFAFTPDFNGPLDILLFPEKNEEVDFITINLCDSNNNPLATSKIQTYKTAKRLYIRYDVIANETYYIELILSPSFPEYATNYTLYVFNKNLS